MSWEETTATAWGSTIGFKIGTPENKEMATNLVNIGIVKEDSINVELADGTKLEWRAVGGKLIDILQGEPTFTISLIVKNLNKSNLEKFWNIEEDESTGELKIFGLSTSKKYSILMGSEVKDSEVFKAPYCSVSMKPHFSEKEGWTQEVSFTLLDRGGTGENKKPLFLIGQVE